MHAHVYIHARKHGLSIQSKLVALLTVISLSVAVKVPPPVKPNIVFVLVDDWGFAEVGFRNPKLKTPNFDDTCQDWS